MEKVPSELLMVVEEELPLKQGLKHMFYPSLLFFHL